jgi:alpha-glucosidase
MLFNSPIVSIISRREAVEVLVGVNRTMKKKNPSPKRCKMKFPDLRKMVLLCVVVFSVSHAQWQSIGNLESFSSDGSVVTIKSAAVLLKVSALSADLVRIRVATSGVFGPDQSWAVIKSDWEEQKFDVRETQDDLQLKTKEMTIRIKKRPLRISFFDRNGVLLNKDDDERGISWSGASVRVWKTMPQSEQYYGLGEKAGALNRRGKCFTMWNTDIPAYKADTDPLYQTIPFFYGINNGRTYGIFFDNSYWSSFDMGKESPDRYSFGAVNGEMNYYFFSGDTPKKVLERFTELVGRMPLPPRWSLGYQQCRWSYYPESRVRKLASDFRSKRIPCDVLYLDIDYMEGYRIFTWSKKNFPEPARMISDLSKDGFKIVTIIDPGIKADSSYSAYLTGRSQNAFLKYPDGQLFLGKVWPGVCAFPDFSSRSARDWWGKNFKALTSVGVRGFWNDMNEPSVFDVPTKTVDLDVIHDDNGLFTPHAKNHNLYGLQMTRATYEGVKSLKPNERPFVLTRASYAGGQRYSAAWTGDNISSWEHLEMAVPMMLGLSICGQPFVGTDIGGFVGSPDGELFARWLQLGVFSTLMRTHTEWGSKDQEPWSYGPEYEEMNKRTIELRYKLLPYVYNEMYKASTSGIPPMRPLSFEYPEDTGYSMNATDFMFGENLLIAPILWSGVRTRSLKLPHGQWYDYWLGKRLQGGSQVTVDAPLDRIPIFVKAGAIIPSQQVLKYSDQAPIDPLTLSIYVGENGSEELYEDDGSSFEYRTGASAKRIVQFSTTNGSHLLSIGEVKGTYRFPDRTLIARFVGIEKRPAGVRLSDETLPQLSPENLDKGQRGWMYDMVTQVVSVRIRDLTKEQIIVLE